MRRRRGRADNRASTLLVLSARNIAGACWVLIFSKGSRAAIRDGLSSLSERLIWVKGPEEECPKLTGKQPSAF
jgi:hypothetical protein